MAHQEYAEREIDREMRNLVNSKSHGSDGMPGEAYIAARKWAITPIAKIAKKINERQAMPGNWTNGTIVYIYKNKGGSDRMWKLQTIIPHAYHIRNMARGDRQKTH